MLILLLLDRSLQLFKLIFIVTQYRVIKNSGTYQENNAVQCMRCYSTEQYSTYSYSNYFSAESARRRVLHFDK